MSSYHLLGRVEIVSERAGGAQTVTPSAPKVRQVLAFLLLRANYLVPAETLISELWDGVPPRSAVTTVQTYIYHLRKFLDAQPDLDLCSDLVQTRQPGYLLSVEPEQLDVHHFRRLAGQARQLCTVGEHQKAMDCADQAMELADGAALANVPQGRLLQAHAAHLEEERLTVQEVRIEAAFALGLHRRQIAELRALVAAHPMNEWLHARLIEALGHSDRRSEALAAYQHLHRVLDEELGLTPSKETRRLQQEILLAS